jgi:hypothetical protein
MEPTEKPEPLDRAPEPAEKSVQVLATMTKIHALSIESPAIIAYLQAIPPDKREIALVHALEVGVTELVARRERFRH